MGPMLPTAVRLLLLALAWAVIEWMGMASPSPWLLVVFAPLVVWGLALGLQEEPRFHVTRSAVEALVAFIPVHLFWMVVTAPSCCHGGCPPMPVAWSLIYGVVAFAQIAIVADALVYGGATLRRWLRDASTDHLSAHERLAQDRGIVQLALLFTWCAASAVVDAGLLAAGLGSIATLSWPYAAAMGFVGLLSFMGTLVAVSHPAPDGEAPARAGRLGPLAWFEFDSAPNRRTWSLSSRRIRGLLDRSAPEPATDGHSFHVEGRRADPQGWWAVAANLQAAMLAAGLGPALAVAVISTIGAYYDNPVQQQWALALQLLLGGPIWVGLSAAVVLLPVWGVRRALMRCFAPSSFRVTSGILETQGRRYYLRGARARLRHDLYGAVLVLEGPDGHFRLRGEHQALVWLRDRVHRDLRDDARDAEEIAGVSRTLAALRGVLAAW